MSPTAKNVNFTTGRYHLKRNISDYGFYSHHRRALMDHLPDGLIVVRADSETIRNNDVAYLFRQSSDFLYLTGIEAPDFALLMDPKRKEVTLFVPDVDEKQLVWRGYIPKPGEAARFFGIRHGALLSTFKDHVRKARRGYHRIYGNPAALKMLDMASLKGLQKRSGELREALDELRAVKSDGEISLLQHANNVSAKGHVAAMKAARPGMHEYEVQAVLEKEFRAGGLHHEGYPSIVASGVNSGVLHYQTNNRRMKEGELLLIDAGGEYRGYTADITRTFPVGKKFSSRQRDVYEIVLKAQKECILRARADTTSADLHRHSLHVLAEGLKQLGLLRGDTSSLVESGAVGIFYPHGLSHLLGLDVHDVSGGRRRRLKVRGKPMLRFNARLEPGFVITIEPGLYFIEALICNPARRKKYRGSVDFARAEKFLGFGGIRIEDDVVIQPDGPPLDLTTVPKEIADIEEIRGLAL